MQSTGDPKSDSKKLWVPKAKAGEREKEIAWRLFLERYRISFERPDSPPVGFDDVYRECTAIARGIVAIEDEEYDK